MASPLRSFSRVDVCVTFVLDSTLEDTWECARDFHARYWERKFSGVDDFSARKLKGKASSELGCKRLFMVGNGRLYEKLSSLDDTKHKMGWILVTHPQTVSPFGQASFLNYASKLRLWKVTATNQTFGEWKGEFFTESCFADQMEEWVSNWYYTGFQGLQTASKFSVPVAQRDVIQRPAMMDSRQAIPVKAPALERLNFHKPQQDPEFDDQMRQAQMQGQQGNGCVQGATNSDPQQSFSSPPSSPHTVSVKERKYSNSSSSDSSRNKGHQHDLSQAKSKSLQAQRADSHRSLQPISEGMHSYNQQSDLYNSMPPFPMSAPQAEDLPYQRKSSNSSGGRNSFKANTHFSGPPVHRTASTPYAFTDPRAHVEKPKQDCKRTFSLESSIGGLAAQQYYRKPLSGQTLYAKIKSSQEAALGPDGCQQPPKGRPPQDLQQYRTLGTLKEEDNSPQASTRTTSSKVATSGSQDLKGYSGSESRSSLDSKQRASSASSASSQGIDRDDFRDQATAQGFEGFDNASRASQVSQPHRQASRHIDWRSSVLPACSNPWPRLPRAQSFAEVSAVSDVFQQFSSGSRQTNRASSQTPSRQSKGPSTPRASESNHVQPEGPRSPFSSFGNLQRYASTAETESSERLPSEPETRNKAQPSERPPFSSDDSSESPSEGLESDPEPSKEEEDADCMTFPTRSQRAMSKDTDHRSSMDVLIADLQERHNAMHGGPEVAQVSESPFAQSASSFFQ